jgi:hypothetical protein
MYASLSAFHYVVVEVEASVVPVQASASPATTKTMLPTTV